MVSTHAWFGAKIDRDSNKCLRPVNTSRNNFSGFVPDDVEWGQTLQMIMMFRVRVETPIKL